MTGQILTGLDIGSSSIRAVEVFQAQPRPIIHAFGHVTMPEGALNGGGIADERTVTNTLKQLWTKQKFKNRNVVLGITNQQVVVRETEIANLPPKEMKRALPFQVRD